MSARTPSTRRWALAGAAFLAVAGAGSLALLREGRPAPVAPAEPEPAAAAPEASRAQATAAAPASDRAVEQPTAAQPAAADAPASEDALLDRLRGEVDVRPAVALRLAQDGDARFPDGAHAEERAYLEMRALVHLDDIVAARDAAERFFARHPGSPLGRDVFRLTGMRPRPY